MLSRKGYLSYKLVNIADFAQIWLKKRRYKRLFISGVYDWMGVNCAGWLWWTGWRLVGVLLVCGAGWLAVPILAADQLEPGSWLVVCWCTIQA